MFQKILTLLINLTGSKKGYEKINPQKDFSDIECDWRIIGNCSYFITLIFKIRIFLHSADDYRSGSL